MRNDGIVPVFVLAALAGTLKHFKVSMPDWLPASIMSGSPMSAWMSVFLWLFLTPFIAIGLGMICAFLFCVAGRTEVTISQTGADLYTGIGPLGRHRRFDARSVQEVRIDNQQWRDNDGERRRTAQIVVEMAEGKAIKFGSWLNEERRMFVTGALRKLLLRTPR